MAVLLEFWFLDHGKVIMKIIRQVPMNRSQYSIGNEPVQGLKVEESTRREWVEEGVELVCVRSLVVNAHIFQAIHDCLVLIRFLNSNSKNLNIDSCIKNDWLHCLLYCTPSTSEKRSTLKIINK